LMRVVLLIDRGSGGVERGIISPEYAESVVDGVGVSGVGEDRDKGLGTNGGTVSTIPSFCFPLLVYTLSSP
jgi:hypothetical protein